MTNRKLVGVLSILLVAVLFMVIGCGDGQRKQSVKPRKTLPHGKVGNKGGPADASVMGGEKEQLKAEPTTDSGTDEQTKTEPPTLGNQEENSQRTDKEESIRAQFQAILKEDGTSALSKDAIPSDDYSLTSITSYTYAQETQQGAGGFVGITTTAVSNGQLGRSSSDQVGELFNETDSGREIQIPMKLKVNSLNGGKSSFNDQKSSKILKSQVPMDNPSIQHTLTNGRTALSLISAMESAGQPTEKGYVIKVNGSDAYLFVYKISNGIRFLLEIPEATAGAKGSEGNLTLHRYIVLTYQSAGT